MRKDVEPQLASSMAEAEGTLSGSFHSSLFWCFFFFPSRVPSVSQELCQAQGKAMMDKIVLAPFGAHERVGF